MVILTNGLELEVAEVFDTYKTSEDFEKLVDISSTKFGEGSIVMAACMDDCVTSLSKKCKQWFADMGSKEIWNVEYRQGFSFIGILGRNKVNEKRAIEKSEPI